MNKRILILSVLFFTVFTLNACQPANQSSVSPANKKPEIVATTTIVGDVVANIGGDLIDLTVLLPVGTDPHAFDPNPQDVAKISRAALVFANGAGLERFLEPLLDNAGASDKIVYVSDGIKLIAAGNSSQNENSVDPHVWTDPNNVIIWVDNIEKALSNLDPDHAHRYHTNAAAYKSKLHQLDSWIKQQVAQIPPENRNIVTDHLIFSYFARTYGFRQIGAIIPGYTTLAQPSAKELASLEDAIAETGAKAILVGNTINPNLAERVAQDTGSKLVTIYTGSLSSPQEGAGTYIDYVRYNVEAIIDALKP